MAGAVSGIDLAYPAPRGAHPLVGRRAPDIPLAGDTPLYHALRPGRFLLVLPPNAASPADPTAGWEDRVDHAIAGGATRTTVLVRPDAYIAWAGADSDPDRQATAIRAALDRYCGPATVDAGIRVRNGG
jgi:hypothetical protein